MIRLKLVRSGFFLCQDEKPRRWLFLGKNPVIEASCAVMLGSAGRLDITGDFLNLADQLRAEFTREVARIGALQKDAIGWSSSTFAWKNPDASDLFLLSCYRLLIRKLAAESSEPTLIVLEDRWLYADCLRDADLGLSAGLSESVFLGVHKAQMVLRGAASRMLWVGRTVAAWARQKFLRRSVAAASDKPEYYIVSIPHTRCFKQGADWNDPFFPGLDEIIHRAGGTVRRLIPTGAYGFEPELAQRSEFVHPLILDATLRDIFASAATLWKAQPLASYALNGIPMPLLAEREWWTDAGSARWCEYRLFDACFRRFRGRVSPAAVIYPYENQPWEKLINLASSGTNTATIGYQHTAAPRFFLSYWLGPEGPGTPLPDHILTSGPWPREILVAEGSPSAKTHVGGSLRFRYLTTAFPKPRQRRPEGPACVLVVATHNAATTRGIVDSVCSAFPDGGAKDRIKLYFRPHPTAPQGSLRHVAGMESVEGALSSQLADFDLVVTTGSTVALEAFFLSVPVILFRPDATLDSMDLGGMVPEDLLEYSSSREMRVRILKRLREPEDVLSDRTALRESLFSPVDEQAWIRCFAPSVTK